METEDIYEINLYRLSDEVIAEIKNALNFYSRHNPLKNDVLVQRAERDLSNVHTVVNNKQTIIEEPISLNQAPKNNIMQEAMVKNTLQLFDSFLDKALEKSGTGQCRKLVEVIKATYNEQVLESLAKE
jgi:hypothetical protein